MVGRTELNSGFAGFHVARASFRCRAGGAGFSDLMILAAAQKSGVHPLYTLDQKAVRLMGVS